MNFLNVGLMFISSHDNGKKMLYLLRRGIEKNNSARTVQAESSKFASLSFQRFQIVTPPRIVANAR